MRLSVFSGISCFFVLIILHFLGSLKTVLRQAQKPAPPKSVPSSSSKTGPIIPIYVPESLPLGADTVETQVMIQGEMDEMAKSLSTSKGQEFGEVEVPTDPPLVSFYWLWSKCFSMFFCFGKPSRYNLRHSKSAVHPVSCESAFSLWKHYVPTQVLRRAQLGLKTSEGGGEEGEGEGKENKKGKGRGRGRGRGRGVAKAKAKGKGTRKKISEEEKEDEEKKEHADTEAATKKDKTNMGQDQKQEVEETPVVPAEESEEGQETKANEVPPAPKRKAKKTKKGEDDEKEKTSKENRMKATKEDPKNEVVMQEEEQKPEEEGPTAEQTRKTKKRSESSTGKENTGETQVEEAQDPKAEKVERPKKRSRDQERATFAKRFEPKGELSKLKWNVLREVFGKMVKPQLTHYSTHEECGGTGLCVCVFFLPPVFVATFLIHSAIQYVIENI